METWLHCFLAFVAAKVESPETRELMPYGQIILMLAQKHGGKGWKAYDTYFCQLEKLIGDNHCALMNEISALRGDFNGLRDEFRELRNILVALQSG